MEVAQKSERRKLNIIKEPVSCKAGCNSCCSRLITITMAEAVVIHEYLVQNKKWSKVREKSIELFKLSHDTDPIAWFKMNISCPILDEKGLCSAYSIRPVVCSTHFVTSDPDLCSPWSSKSGSYKSVDMGDLYIEFQEKISSKIDSYGIFNLRLPLPTALLLAERIQVQSNLDFQQTMNMLFNELR
jgi:Fe-S-cluster containining protein